MLGLSYPEEWVDIRDNLKLPFDETLQIYLEYDDYPIGAEIKQVRIKFFSFLFILYYIIGRCNSFRISINVQYDKSSSSK